MLSVPKVKMSSGRKREYHDLSCNSNTTANFGFVQPTFCREILPNGKFKVSVATQVLNVPMPVPTNADISLKHKHVFVPYVDVCPQFEAFLAAQSYRPGYGTPYVPNSLPKFDSVLICQYVLGRFADWTVHMRNTDYVPPVDPDESAGSAKKTRTDYVEGDPQPSYEYTPILMDGTEKDSDKLNWIKDVYNMLFHPTTFGEGNYADDTYVYGRKIDSAMYLPNALRIMPSAELFTGSYSRGTNEDRTWGNWLLGGWQYIGDNTVATSNSNFDYQDYDSRPNGLFVGNPSNDYVSLEGADFISKFGPTEGAGDYVIAFRLRPGAKMYRSILLGLGYQFTPNLFGKVDDCNWLKLFAYYKAWFNLYRPKRELSFTTTTCYNLIKLCELATAEDVMYPDHATTKMQLHVDVCKFIESLCFGCMYYLKQDYFGMSVLTPNANYMADDGALRVNESGLEGLSYDYSSYVSIPGSDNGPVQLEPYSSNISALGMGMALKILKYVNKNTVVGRSIHDYIKAHFGVSLDSSHDLDTVYEIGEVNVPIRIVPVTSTADTDTDHLGSYAARGYGQSGDNTFSFENNRKTHGVWLTLSCIVPNSGYYQGILRENMALTRYEFPTSECDALGYDTLLRSEVSADYPVQVSEFNQPNDNDFNLKKAFGFNPRYSANKVGRDIVSGDLSLRGYRNDYEGYQIERMFPYESRLPYWINNAQGKVNMYSRLAKPLFIPTVVFDNFRRIDPTDKYGNYNRMFYSTSVLDDHFIILSHYKVDAWLPLKSLSDSFDTITDEDGKVIKMTHS